MVSLELKKYLPRTRIDTNVGSFRTFYLYERREQYRNTSNRRKTTKLIYIHFASSALCSVINSKNRLKKVWNILKFIQENSLPRITETKQNILNCGQLQTPLCRVFFRMR